VSVYSYPESRVIDRVAFRRTANGSLRAYLHAGDDVPPEQLTDILQTLRRMDIDCIPFNHEGTPSIEVRGFHRESKLITILHNNKWVDDRPVIVPDQDDKSKWSDRLKNRSLQAAGGLYAFGDVNFIAYGIKDSSPLDMAAGILYALPTPVLLAYGRNDQSQLQIKDFARHMAKEFREEVATLPENCSLEHITADRKKGLMEQASDLLQRYPSEFMNLCYAGAGACIFLAARKHLSGLKAHGVPENTVSDWLGHLTKTQPNATREVARDLALKNIRTENLLNAGVGVSTVASGMIGTLVREKAHDPDAPKSTGLAGIWDFVRERPLTVAGAGFMVCTLLHAAATWVATKGQDAKHKQAVPYRVAFVISALMAELMVAISSKGHGEGVVSDRSVDNSAIAIAANLIVKQPKGLQNHLIEEMGKFLGRNDVLAMKDQDAVDTLRKEVEALRGNPWVQAESGNAVHQGGEVPAAATREAAGPVTLSLLKENPPSAPSAWQAKISAEPAAGQQQAPV